MSLENHTIIFGLGLFLGAVSTFGFFAFIGRKMAQKQKEEYLTDPKKYLEKVNKEMQEK
jgi:hypothetical protein